MKKILSGLFGLILVLAAVVLIGPGFVDWNKYKAEITTRAKAATGRDLTIGGDIQISVLPAPALIAHDVALANLEGATAPDMVRLRSLEVRIALGPLLRGNIQVETIKLVDPVIELEVLADGRKNWEFSPAEIKEEEPAPSNEQNSGPDAEAPEPAPAAEPAIRLDNFTIENATLIYRDQQAGTVERIENLQARIAAASLKGPIESSGTLVARGIPLKFESLIGEVIHGRTVPVSLTLGTAASQGKVQINGTLVSLADAPKFKGKIKAEGNSLAAIVAAATAGGPLPGFASQAFAVEGAVVASAKGIEVKELVMRLGDAEASGVASVEFGEVLTVAGRLTVNHVNLDKWLEIPAVAPPTPSSKDSEKPEKNGRTKASITLDPVRPPTKSKPSEPSSATALAIPTDLAGSINLVVDAITYKGAIVRQVRASAELASGKITISQLTAQFPGGSEVAAFGFGSIVDGQPQFEGEVELSVSDVRSVLSWLDVPAPPVPSDRLRKLTLVGNITASPKQVQIANLDIGLDSSRLTGGITVALRKRPAFGADLTLDRINLDAYLATPTMREAEIPPSAGAGGEAKVEAGGNPAKNNKPAADPFAVLSALDDFDANLKLRIKSLVYRKSPIKGVVLDGTLFNGALKLRQASVDNLAGATVKVSGTFDGLGGIPAMKGVRFDFRAADTSGLFRMAGVEPPILTRSLGKISLKGQLDGGLLVPRFDLTVGAAGVTAGLKGKMTLLPVPAIDGILSARHRDLARLLSTLKVDYRPAGPIGGVTIAAAIKGNASRVTIGQLKAGVGKVRLQGEATLTLDGPRLMFAANLTSGDIVIDPFLPATRAASLDPAPRHPYGRPGVVPEAWPAPPRPDREGKRLHTLVAAAGGRWPSQPLDLSALGAVDADIKLKSTAVVFQAYRVENADLAATLTGGILTVSRLTGTVFGGALQANAVVNGNGRPKLDAALAVRGIDVSRATRAVTGKALATGSMQGNFKVTTSGSSVADMVGTLAGTGALALSRIDVKAAGKGTALAGALGLADISGTFRIDRGVAHSNDLKLSSNLGTGQAKGSIDLPNWLIDVEGQVQLSQNLLTQFLSRKIGAPQVLPIRIKGTLDSPNVKIDTSKMPSGGVPLPAVGKLLGNKGIGGFLQKLLPGQQSTQQPAQQQPQSGEPPPPPPPERKFRPEDLLKQLFKR